MNNLHRLGRLLLGSIFFCMILGWQTAAAATSLEGFWKGPLKMPGGQLEVVFRLVSLTNGAYFATLDVPLQKISRLPVTVTTHGDTVVFEAEDVGSRFTGQLLPGGKEVQGIWKQPGYTVPMTLQYAPPPISTAPKARLTPPYREEEVIYTNSAADLRFGGQLTVPAGEGPFPAVVLVADEAGYDRDGTIGEYRLLGILGDYLTRRGIAVLRFDSRGAGQTGGMLATVDETVTDVQAALNYLRTRPEINLGQLGVIGHGLGGNVALLTASQAMPPNFVVALAAHGQRGATLTVEQHANTLKSLGADEAQVEAEVKRQQAMMEVIQNTANPAQARAIVANMIRQTNPSVDSVTARAGAVELTTRRYRSYLAFDPLLKLGQVKCPVLLLNGTADLNVAPETNLTALNKALKTNGAVTNRKLAGVNHLFQGDPATWPLVNGVPKESFSPEAEEIIRQWIVGLFPAKKP